MAASQRRQLVFGAVAVTVLLYLWIALARRMRAALRYRRLFLALPSKRSPRLSFFGNLYHGLLKPNDRKLIAKSSLAEVLRRRAIAQLMRVCRESGGAGLCTAHFVNPAIFGSTQIAKVLLFDIQLVKELLSAKAQHLCTKGSTYRLSSPLIGDSVLSLSGDTWGLHRRVLDAGFKRNDMVERGLGAIWRTTGELCAKLAAGGDGKVWDMHEEFLKLTMDVLGRVGFSYDFGSLTAPTTADAPLYGAFKTILTTLNDRVMLPPLKHTAFLPTPGNLRLRRALGQLEGVVKKVIVQRRAEYECAAREGRAGELCVRDLMDAMLMIADKEPPHRYLSDTEVLDNTKTLLFAGHDTTAAALSWLTYLLATHPEKEARLLSELDAVLGVFVPESRGGGHSLTVEKVEACVYLNACVTETLRLYPSAGFTRDAVADVELGGYTIPKGAEIGVFPYMMHRDPNYYEQPDDFLPERWLADEHPQAPQGGEQEQEQQQPDGSVLLRRPGSSSLSLQSTMGILGRKGAFLPFSLGPRNCVGRSLALLELRVVVIELLRRFRFEPPPGGDPDFQNDPALLLTLNPVSMRLIPRSR